MGTTQVLHRWLEIPIREYVREHTIGEWRSFWAGQVLSDYPVEIMSVLFFTRVGLKMVGKSSHEEKYLGFLSIAFYFLVSGYIPHHDVPAIKAMKDAFMRERPVPSDSFAFPSGHTAAASYLAGMLTTGLDSANASDVSKGSTTGTRSPLSRDGGKKWRRAVHWVLPVLMVASGRVISERHWLGDTFAGAAFGAGSVFLLLALHQCLSILPWNKE